MRTGIRGWLRPSEPLHELTSGAAVSKILADRGAKVAINYSSNKDRAEQTRDSLAGSGHVIIPGDAFSHEGVNKIAAEAIKGLGGLDIVVSNVGWTQFANFNDIGEYCCERGCGILVIDERPDPRSRVLRDRDPFGL